MDIKKGDTYIVASNAFSLDWHYNDKKVTALEDSSWGDSTVRVRCQCCGEIKEVDKDYLR